MCVCVCVFVCVCVCACVRVRCVCLIFKSIVLTVVLVFQSISPLNIINVQCKIIVTNADPAACDHRTNMGKSCFPFHCIIDTS